MGSLVGQTFGDLIVLKYEDSVEYAGVWRSKWLCQCACGNQVSVFGSNLKKKTHGTKSCGCYVRRHMLPAGQAGKNAVLRDYKKGAVGRNLGWELSDELFFSLIAENCHFCGAAPSAVMKQLGNFTYNGIDRIDNSLGYIKWNVVPCCKWCNAMKGALTEGKFISHVFRICAHHVVKTDPSTNSVNYFSEAASRMADKVLRKSDGDILQ
jgi:hypothetical protein